MRWQFGAVQLTEWDADNFLGLQVDPVQSGSEAGAARLAEVHYQYGFFGRPRDPDNDGLGCSSLIYDRGNRERYAWLGSDPRTLPLLPSGAKGSSYQFAYTDDSKLSFHEIDGETGTQSFYVPVGSSAHLVQVGVDSNGKSVIKLQHSEGMAVVMFEETVIIHNAAGDGYLEVNADGVTCNGNLKLNGGLDVGGSGALPIAKSAELLTWAALVNAALNSAGFPVAPLSPTVATTLLKGK